MEELVSEELGRLTVGVGREWKLTRSSLESACGAATVEW